VGDLVSAVHILPAIGGSFKVCFQPFVDALAARNAGIWRMCINGNIGASAAKAELICRYYVVAKATTHKDLDLFT
jgi:hypothetical protein